MSFKKVYWLNQTSVTFECTKICVFLERNRDRPNMGFEYFIRPENKIGGL